MRAWGLGLGACLIGAVFGIGLSAQEPFDSAQGKPRTVWDGVYTAAQASRGAVAYDAECASCHGPSGAGGGMAPPLVGAAYSANYDGLTVGDLFDRNRTTMPPGKEGQLTAQQIADITAFMLKVNSFPAGDQELPAQGMLLKSIQYLAVPPEKPNQGDRPPGTHQDNTRGEEWIKRLEPVERERHGPAGALVCHIRNALTDTGAQPWQR